MSVSASAKARVLVIASPGEGQQALRPYVKACAQQLSQRGMSVEVSEGRSIDRFHLFKAKTVVVFACKAGFFSGKVQSQPLHQALAAAGGVNGQQAYAVLVNRGLFGHRARLRLMKVLEGEGLLLLDSAMVRSVNEMKAQLQAWLFEN